NLTQARAQVESALEIIESLRTNVISRALRASYFVAARQHYDLYIDLLMQLHQLRPAEGFDAITLHASERAHSRSLLELLVESGADIRQGVDSALLDRERTLRQQLTTKAELRIQLLRNKSSEKQIAENEKEIEALIRQCQEVEAQIHATSPRYVGLTQPPASVTPLLPATRALTLEPRAPLRLQ